MDLVLGLMLLAVLAAAGVAWLARRPGDAMTTLLVGLLVSFALPQRFVVRGLDTAGAPSLLVGVAFLALWALGRIRPARPLDRRPDATAVLALVYLAVWLLDFGLGGLRADVDTSLESLLRAALDIAALLGVLLYTRDAIRTQHDLERLLRGITLLGGAVGLLGLVQFMLGADPLRTLQLPLLEEAATLDRVRIRGSFLRVRGTAYHPIEFSTVLAMLLPLAVGFALRSRRLATRQLYAVCAGVLGIAAMLSISRSGMVAIAAGLLVAAVHLTSRDRLRLAAAGGIALVGVYLSIPTLLGTFRSLFLDTGDDPSIANRLNDIPFVFDVLRRNPLLGGSDPRVSVGDRLLDNEYFRRLVDGGLLELVALLALLLVPLALAWARAQVGGDRDARTLAGMIAASLVAGSVSLLTFDGFFFRLFTTVLLVLVAAGCAAWRLRDEDDRAAVQAPQRHAVGRS